MGLLESGSMICLKLACRPNLPIIIRLRLVVGAMIGVLKKMKEKVI